ncbi:MAG: hypothetical protein D6834_00930 [Aquificota bacterium]|nr:MAG: hypothetical protein D6834_00930 [Aquificota bacterium]
MNYEIIRKSLKTHNNLLEDMILNENIDLDKLEKILNEAIKIKKEIPSNLNKNQIKEIDSLIEKVINNVNKLKIILVSKVEELQKQEKANISYLRNQKI